MPSIRWKWIDGKNISLRFNFINLKVGQKRSSSNVKLNPNLWAETLDILEKAKILQKTADFYKKCFKWKIRLSFPIFSNISDFKNCLCKTRTIILSKTKFVAELWKMIGNHIFRQMSFIGVKREFILVFPQFFLCFQKVFKLIFCDLLKSHLIDPIFWLFFGRESFYWHYIVFLKNSKTQYKRLFLL